MKNSIQQIQHGFQNLEVRIQEETSSLCKGSTDVPHAFSQCLSSKQPSPTNIHNRDLTVIRLEDNTLWCKEMNRTLPSTPQGDLDWVQLEREIALRQWFYPLQQGQQLTDIHSI